MAQTWQTRTCATALVLGLASATNLLSESAGAAGSRQAPAKAAAEAKAPEKDAAASQRDLEAGIVALQSGKADQAVQQISAALSAGKLPPPQMARALYYRGLAYRKQGKPAQAIADLTSALWLKNGLDGTLKADALENRAAAYREAGLSDQADADDKKAAAAARSPAAPAQTQAAQAAPAASSGGIGGFFENLFGGSPAATPASVAPAAPPRVASAEPFAPTLGWSENTEVVQKVQKTAAAPASFGTVVTPAAAPSRGPVRTVAPAAPAPAQVETSSTESDPRPAAARHKPGPRLQVASVRSLEEARTIAARVKAFKAPELSGKEPEIDQTSVGNMGTLYRVLVGPFASADEPRLLCVKLRGSGLDCLIVPQ
jgi:hypothetical protein